MRIALASLFVVGCSGGGDAPVDEQPIDAPNPPPCPPPGGPLCVAGMFPPTSLCGNDRIDSCVMRINVCRYQPGGQEPCDGALLSKSCTELGYFGGETSCSSDCRTHVLDCNACAFESGQCATRSGFEMRGGAAVSGTRLAVAVTQGWLVAIDAPPRLTPLDSSGQLGTSSVALPATATAPVMAYGPGGRALVAWIDLASSPRPVRMALTDETGATVVGETTLFTISGSHVAVTTDGTTFFVASDGRLARVAPDGTFAVVSGFPQGLHGVDVSWNGTRGWYTGDTNSAFSVQRFDSAGMPVGGAQNPGQVFDTAAHGDSFIHVYRGLNEYRLGGLSTPSGIGPLIGIAPTPAVFPPVPLPAWRIEHVGAQIVVLWNASRLQLKFMTP